MTSEGLDESDLGTPVQCTPSPSPLKTPAGELDARPRIGCHQQPIASRHIVTVTAWHGTCTEAFLEAKAAAYC